MAGWSAADPRGGGAPPLDWGQKNFIAPPKNTHICKPPFACQNVLKLTYSNLEFQNFPGGPPDPLFKGGEEGEGRGGEGGEREGNGGRGRIGKGGEGREGTEEGRRGGMGVGRGGEGARHPPPRDKLWIRPCIRYTFPLV